MISVCEFVKNFWQLSPINHYWHKLQSILDRQRLNIYEKMRSNAAPPETAICTVNDFLVTAGDLQRLAPGQWLNDVLINCYCQLLIERQRLSAAGNPGAEKIVILPSQFFGNFYNTEKSSFYKDAVN
jgi:Ulp1 family protease